MNGVNSSKSVAKVVFGSVIAVAVSILAFIIGGGLSALLSALFAVPLGIGLPLTFAAAVLSSLLAIKLMSRVRGDAMQHSIRPTETELVASGEPLSRSASLQVSNLEASPGQIDPSKVSVAVSSRVDEGLSEFVVMLTFASPSSLREVEAYIKSRLPFMANIRLRAHKGRLTWTWLTYAGWLRYQRSGMYAKYIEISELSDRKYTAKFNFSEANKARKKHTGFMIVLLLGSVVFHPLAIAAIPFSFFWMFSSRGAPQLPETKAASDDMLFRLQN